MSIAAASTTFHLWSLCEDVIVEPGESDDELVLTGHWGTERIEQPDPLLREALRRMELGPVLLANIVAGEDGSDSGDATHLVMLPTLSRLAPHLVRTLGLDDLKGPLLSVSAASRHAAFTPVRLPARRPVRLPKDVSLTLESAGFALESSGSPHRVVLHRPEAVWVVGLLAWPVTADAASAALPLPPEVTAAVMDYLAGAGMAAPVDPPEAAGADPDCVAAEDWPTYP
ncbi:NADH oxidase [Streptomyces sp. A5-4]|uniref:NADH oxidase n=1 Tax=Streptomyces sp. A5-4 TaxID=3384771 RepID=UPI003DA8A37A